MSVTVTVEDDGQMVLTENGQTHAPISVEAAQALADKIPEAQNATANAGITAAIRSLTDAIKPGTDGFAVQATITSEAIVATVDADTYTRIQTALDATPGNDGALRQGPVVVWSE